MGHDWAASRAAGMQMPSKGVERRQEARLGGQAGPLINAMQRCLHNRNYKLLLQCSTQTVVTELHVRDSTT